MQRDGNTKENRTKVDQTNKTKTSIELMLKSLADDYIPSVKKRVDIFAENLSNLFKKYDEESKVSVNSIFEEKDDVYINKINDSHLHYVFKIGGKCAAILSLDHLSTKSFIAMLLQIKNLGSSAEENTLEVNKVTDTEKNLLTLVVNMVDSALKSSFDVTETQITRVSSLVPYIKENKIAITEISLGNSKGSIALILEPNFINKSLSSKKKIDTEFMKKNMENLKVEMKFLTAQKKITLNYLSHLKEEDVLMFSGKVNIIINNKVLGFGEIGHMGERIAIMCTNFNKG